MTFFDIVRNALMAGFGVQEKVSEFVNELVKKGELSESQGAKLVKEWAEKADKSTEQLGKSLSELVTKAAEKITPPWSEEIERLNKKVQTLSARVKRLEGIEEERAEEG